MKGGSSDNSSAWVIFTVLWDENLKNESGNLGLNPAAREDKIKIWIKTVV